MWGSIAPGMTADSLDISPAMKLQSVRDRIASAAIAGGRQTGDITLIAITKTRPQAAIMPLMAAGQRHFGENRVQEAMEKWLGLREASPDSVLHLVGQLQSNKAKDAVALFDVIHSLDRPSLLVALAREMDAAGRKVPCFVQVNIGQEEQKGGCPIAEVPALLKAAHDADVPVVGLMCVPPAHVEAAPYFALLAKMGRDCGLADLSMGMSGDFEAAIMLGATHIRVGSALFDDRG
jgi:PLP dependent protein